MGAVWDIPGQFCTLQFVPREYDLQHECITVTMYESDTSADLLQGIQLFIQHAQVTSLASLRDIMQDKYGWKLKTALYKIN